MAAVNVPPPFLDRFPSTSFSPGGSWAGVLPAAESPLTVGTRMVIVQTAGNMGLVLSDGSTNNTELIAVTAGMVFNLAAIAVSAANTAVVLGVY